MKVLVTVHLGIPGGDPERVHDEADRLMVALLDAMRSDRAIGDPSVSSASDDGTVAASAVVIAGSAAEAATYLSAVVGGLTDYRMLAVEHEVLPLARPRRRRRRG